MLTKNSIVWYIQNVLNDVNTLNYGEVMVDKKDELKAVQDLFLDKINLLCKNFGLNNIMAQLYATLYFNGKPMSLNDMVEQLEISKASASVNIRALERYGAVKRVWVKGSRKDFYEAEADIAKVIVSRVTSMGQKRISEFNNLITVSYDALDLIKDQDKKESVMVFRERLGKLKNLYEKAQAIFDLLQAASLKDMSGVVTQAGRSREGL